MKSHVKNYINHRDIGMDDIFMCEYCRKEKAVDIHHLSYRSHGGNDLPDNLIALCRKCHLAHHTKNNPTTKQLKEKRKLLP